MCAAPVETASDRVCSHCSTVCFGRPLKKQMIFVRSIGFGGEGRRVVAVFLIVGKVRASALCVKCKSHRSQVIYRFSQAKFFATRLQHIVHGCLSFKTQEETLRETTVSNANKSHHQKRPGAHPPPPPTNLGLHP